MLKKDLRLIYKEKRAELTQEEVEDLSQGILFMLRQLFGKIKFKHVNCFLTSDEKKEVHTKEILELLWKKGIETSVPYSNYDTLEMRCAEMTEHTSMEIDSQGIPQPVDPFFASSETIDIVLVPLLCFDDKGYRVGYGKGMYDRFLKNCKSNVITIGLSFFEECDSISDCNQYDVPLHYVVTPKHIYTYAGISLEA